MTEPADFLHRREAQERELARHAIDPAIRNIHLDLAARYRALATAAPEAAYVPKLRIVAESKSL